MAHSVRVFAGRAVEMKKTEGRYWLCSNFLLIVTYMPALLGE